MSTLALTPGVTSEAFPYVCSELAAAALFTYDILICLDEEITHVWWSPRSIPKTLFMVSRYVGLAVIGTMPVIAFYADPSAACRAYLPVQFLVLQAVAFCCDGLLLMRVAAVFNHKRWLCRTLYGLYTLAYLIESAIAILNFVTSLKATPVPDEWDCIITRHASGGNLLDTIVTLPILIFNLILFTLTVIHLSPYWRAREKNQTHILTLILEEGTIYFAIVCAALLAETIVPLLLTDDLGVAWLALIPIASNRLFLSLRAAASGSLNSGDDTNPVSYTPASALVVRPSGGSEQTTGQSTSNVVQRLNTVSSRLSTTTPWM
ncbi:hypothetical protein DACRYDRAFT_25238 [Dacryopinax primogenitus]|uniref:DUF6533 domain-containing protein n=1 Tax=Dacryopinax primogenitus (strain DJM 731) TaxID=1858805 RepID=M5FPJ5_DACPD|nr:uncharacterized protein DACRYDRAFT_25238 [Dacryopinax primogenitus]EJT97113.1 hypothetical protein DACRYDRAFT_25238 [Dacryopinax primogenitus]